MISFNALSLHAKDKGFDLEVIGQFSAIQVINNKVIHLKTFTDMMTGIKKNGVYHWFKGWPSLSHSFEATELFYQESYSQKTGKYSFNFSTVHRMAKSAIRK